VLFDRLLTVASSIIVESPSEQIRKTSFAQASTVKLST
jgi:hypothetical protein